MFGSIWRAHTADYWSDLEDGSGKQKAKHQAGGSSLRNSVSTSAVVRAEGAEASRQPAK